MTAIKDIVDLITQLSNNIQDRKVATELFNIIKIANQIQSDMFDLQKENLDLKKENQELTEKLNNKNRATIFHKNLIWLENDKNPYCPSCYDSDQKLIHMHTFEGHYSCPKCSHYADMVQHP